VFQDVIGQTVFSGRMSPDSPRKRRRRVILIGFLVAVLAAGGAAAFVLQHQPGDVSNPNVEFDASPTATPTPEQTPQPKKVRDFRWPVYGYSNDRRRQLDVPRSLRPPFKRVWSFNGRHLLEFPPVMAKRSLYLLKDNGKINALNKNTGKVRWARTVGRLAASSPAIHGNRVYLTVLLRTGGSGGRALALSAGTGKVLWSRPLPSRTESSPVVANGAVYFGSENGTVYALRESDGGVRWTFHAAGPVKGGLALKDGRLYFGDYAGRMYAIRAGDGRQVWQAKTKGARFGFASGRFYATPAVAYGRVYLGNVDGNVYSFSARTGELAWRTRTSGYVYSSPALGAGPGGKPTVFVGSYDGNFYAMDARTGAVKWRYGGGSKISGGPTLLGDIIYFSDLGRRHTIGLGVNTGRKVFDFPRGGYNPVITDGRTLYLIGYGAMYALRPLSDAQQQRIAKRKKAHRVAVRHRRRAAARRDRALQHSCMVAARGAHSKRRTRVIAFRRCVARRRAAATHRACVRVAREHHSKKAARRRSVRRCVTRNRR
jgi:outer membrane protein assembly factor BamB